MTRKQLRDFLVFWEKLPDLAFPPGAEKDAWIAVLRVRVGRIPDDALTDFVDVWRRRYEQSEADRVSSAARGNALLTLVGVIIAATTLIVSSAAKALLFWQAATVVIGLLLLVAVAATVVLAIRVQQVSNWDVPRVEPEGASSVRELRVTEAVEFMAAAEQNRKRISNVIGYLRDAQRWALVAIMLLVALAPTAVIASFTKPPETSPSPSPVASPAWTTVPSMSPTGAPSPTAVASPTPALPPSPADRSPTPSSS